MWQASSSSEPIIVKRKLLVLSEQAISEIMQKTFTMHRPNPFFTVVLRRCTSNLTIHTSKNQAAPQLQSNLVMTLFAQVSFVLEEAFQGSPALSILQLRNCQNCYPHLPSYWPIESVRPDHWKKFCMLSLQ